MRLLLLALLLLPVAACDSTAPPQEEEEEEEALGPIDIEYVIDAPASIESFTIFYTGADGQTVVFPQPDPFAFPFVRVIQVPEGTAGTFSARIQGFMSEGAARVTIEAVQNDEVIATAETVEGATGEGELEAEAQIALGS